MNYRLAVVHWFPLEQYPPAQNLLNYFGDQPAFCVLACSTHNDRGRRAFAHNRVKVARWKFPSRALSRFNRLCLFAGFPLFVLWQLIIFRPQVLLYFEPHSSFPAFLYLTIARHCRLFIHYHEYRDRDEFCQPGNRLIAVYHWFERRFLYHRAARISQTNRDRVRMFLEDDPGVDARKMREMPNLPPRRWFAAAYSVWPAPDEPLKMVYAGAVSRRDTFIEPLVEWILRKPDFPICLDLFINNIDSETHGYLGGLCDPRIHFHSGGVEYEQLPELLARYHVGLILYRGNTRNYVYNAPNKLFEYLVCGLDVWYPAAMLGVKPFARLDKAPRVIEVNFENLDAMDLHLLRSRNGLPETPWTESCESQLAILEAEMRGRVFKCSSHTVVRDGSP